MTPQFFGVSEQAGRDRNDDSFVTEASPAVFAVADGIGTKRGGLEASRTAVAALVRRIAALPPADRLVDARLREAVAAVNEEVMAVGREQPNLEGLGTTLSAVVLEQGRGRVIHLGDSRVYLLRDDSLERLTRDHTVADDLVAMNRLRPEEVARHPMRGWLSRLLGSPADAEPDITPVDPLPGDVLILVTDGITSVLSDVEIRTLATEVRVLGAEAVCRRLSSEALTRNPPDNVTVVAVQVRGAVPPRGEGRP